MSEYILVTGAAGFIGSHICEELLSLGENVIGIDNFDPYYDRSIKENNLAQIKKTASNNGYFAFYELSINDRVRLFEKLNAYKIKLVIHLAAKAGVRPSIEDPVGYGVTNIQGTIDILELCVKKEVKKFVFASSSSVYGNTEEVPFTETQKIDKPISPYAATKASCEMLVHTYSYIHNIDAACLRFFTVYGPRQRPDLAIHKFTRLISEGKEIPVFGDGNSRRDYTYIDDIVDGIIKSITWLNKTHPHTVYEVFNLGESETIKLTGMISLIEKALDKSANLNWLPKQQGDVDKTFADISKAKTILGYLPKTKPEEGIGKFVKWFKSLS